MKIFKLEKSIESLVQNNKATCDVDYILRSNEDNRLELAKACIGNACAFSAIKEENFKITDDIMPISSILVTDIWNANNDVFTAEEIVKAEETPHFKPINWMHRGSEDSENENIGVMVKAQLISGDLPNMDFIDNEYRQELLSSENKTLSGKVHIKQDGIIWSQYFPTYASKIKAGIDKGNLYVSMECFFEDFGYCLRKNENDEKPIFINRTESSSSMTKDLVQYKGSGYTKYKGSKYQIGRWLKNIIFSGQGIVAEPANKRKGKILSVIINNNAKADISQEFDPNATNPPTGPVQEPGAMLNPQELQTGAPGEPVTSKDPTSKENLPKTFEIPLDGLLFYSQKEASKVSEIELGCTGYHIYLQDRHGDAPLLYAKLLGDPSDLEDQLKVAQYRPCADEQELRFVLQNMAKKGLVLRRSGRLSDTQQSSQQPGSGGGGSTTAPTSQEPVVDNTQAPSADPNSQTPVGNTSADLAATKTNKRISPNINLTNIDNAVYNTPRENNMTDINEEELEKVITQAAEVIKTVKSENKEYEEAVILATEHIEQLNIKIAEFENFANSVEQIAEKAYSNKIGADRFSQIKTLLGNDSEITAEDLASMDEKTFASLKKSISKVVSSIDKAAEEIVNANTAAKAVSMAKRPISAAFIVPETRADKLNPAESLIGFTMGKKR